MANRAVIILVLVTLITTVIAVEFISNSWNNIRQDSDKELPILRINDSDDDDDNFNELYQTCLAYYSQCRQSSENCELCAITCFMTSNRAVDPESKELLAEMAASCEHGSFDSLEAENTGRLRNFVHLCSL